MSILASKVAAIGAAVRSGLWVRRRRGVSLSRQLLELSQLKLRGIGATTYYRYAMFDRKRFPDLATKLTYREPDLAKEYWRFFDPALRGIGADKHILYRLLASFGLPAPQIWALYAPRSDGFERHRALTKRRELAAYLGDHRNLPLFGKPARGAHGAGARGIAGGSGRDRLRLVTGEVVSASEVVSFVHGLAVAQGTYLFTELLEPAADMQRLCGSTLPAARIVTLVRDGEPELLSTSILLPLDRRHTCNSLGLTTGNMCAAVDPATGRIHNVLGSLGPDLRHQPVHPQTGARLEGHVIEGWGAAAALALEASRALSAFRMQHWDVGLTARGPVLLELNLDASIQPLQMHGPPGAYTRQYESFAKTHRVW